jgi:hypothetical protein
MYTVFSDDHELYPAAAGLRLAEAWTLMMALLACDYAFERDGAGRMRLFLWNSPEAVADRMEEPMNDGRDWSLFSSNIPENALARVAIMHRFVGHALRGVHLVTDETYRLDELRAQQPKAVAASCSLNRGGAKTRSLSGLVTR